MTNQNAPAIRTISPATLEIANALGTMEAGDQYAEAVQPSLLRGLDLDKLVPRRYDLGMDDFVGDSAFKNEKENRVLSLSFRKKATNAPSPSKCTCLQSSENLADRSESWFEFGDDETP